MLQAYGITILIIAIAAIILNVYFSFSNSSTYAMM
jgi:uncharacterized protein YoxC